MWKRIFALTVLCVFLLTLTGCSFSFNFGNGIDQQEEKTATVEEALASFSEAEIITYVERNYVPGQIFENVTDVSATTWDEISGDELRDKNGETLWEYVERILRENEEEQRRLEEEMAPFTESAPAPSSAPGRFDFSSMRDNVVQNEIPQGQSHNVPPVDPSN